MTCRASLRQRGFSLLELLVAFAIMAFSLGVLYRVTASDARSVGDAELYQRALILAQSLQVLQDSVPASGWSASGQSGVFTWSARSAPYPTAVSASKPSAIGLHEVTYTVTWGDGGRVRQLAWSTLLPQSLDPLPGAVRR